MKNKTPKTGLFINRSEGVQWYWHLKASNGRIVAGGYGFNTKRNVINSLRSVYNFFYKGIPPVYNLTTNQYNKV